ncbi:hypothetical protein DF185_11185 [Marinifilum breve]|uniref:Amine oxidase domain-containing protein n=1 Tax=Marinifilum breve TaxID=2184082 RepID=A0A2V3ZY78_9BACT|nr:FAD-dependent oxidoreductase [Marinifilum breve]PXY01201.1 hypothetical protein DF185_11185 [Marinifilum breve]
MKKYSYLLVLLLTVQLALGCNSDGHDMNSGNYDYDVVIVGGGFSGLTAAYYLKNKNVLVLEKEKVPGGRCISGHWNGFHYPKGTEYIGKPDGVLKKVLNKLGIKAKQIPAPTDGIAYKGQFYFGNELLDFLSMEEKQQHYKLMLHLQRLNDDDIEDVIFDDQEYLMDYEKLDQISVKDWMSKQGYSELLQKFVDIENRGLFGTDNANYSMFFNIPEMAFDLPTVESINESEVYSFEEGMYSVVQVLAKKLGNSVVNGAYVQQVDVNEDSTVKVQYVKDGVSHEVRARSVIMATPAPVTANLLGDDFAEELKETLQKIQYSQYATINFFTKKRMLKETWSVSCIDEGQVVTLYDATRPQVSNDYTGKSILSVYMAPESAYDHNFNKQSDAVLLANAYQTLVKHYPNFKQEVIDYDINRFEYAFPIFSPLYAPKLDLLLKHPDTKGPVFLAGDYMVYATVDGALTSAINAAKNVKKYLKQ